MENRWVRGKGCVCWLAVCEGVRGGLVGGLGRKVGFGGSVKWVVREGVRWV